MNKFYIILPLVGLLIFGGFYYQSNKAYKAELEIKQAAAQAELKEKQRLDREASQLAYQAAIEAQAQRHKEREERERIDAEKKENRLDLEEARQKAFDDRRRLREQAERLKQDVAAIQDDVTKVEATKQAHTDELAFLRDYVKSAKTNANSYYELLEKITNAEKAVAKAAAAAAAVKK
jgi:colicin import membrane protein